MIQHRCIAYGTSRVRQTVNQTLFHVIDFVKKVFVSLYVVVKSKNNRRKFNVIFEYFAYRNKEIVEKSFNYKSLNEQYR